ncbi:hypothetical protein KKF91_02065 [Myxococcota bacterium]|nr:hypothetical protein [Myxococcota bacterium]MBU1429323.1 hypothetical protein [Myxococcota bacterium]
MPAPPAATQPAAAPSAAGPLNLSGVVHAATTQLTAQVDGLDQALVEQIAWEIIPKLAETLLKEEIARVVRERIAAAR